MDSLAFPCGQVSTSAVSGKGSHFPNPRWFKFYYYSFLLLSGLAWLVSLGWLELNTIIIFALNDVVRISKSLEQRNCQVRSFTTPCNKVNCPLLSSSATHPLNHLTTLMSKNSGVPTRPFFLPFLNISSILPLLTTPVLPPTLPNYHSLLSFPY